MCGKSTDYKLNTFFYFLKYSDQLKNIKKLYTRKLEV